ncbi:MAG: hypothetical protein J3K34DRAFT_442537 [Monoraphidium minutum]|nr:MAG: hypothetical protein J3K34DRAFT_442537 [Monoraphidium minutum]
MPAAMRSHVSWGGSSGRPVSRLVARSCTAQGRDMNRPHIRAFMAWSSCLRRGSRCAAPRSTCRSVTASAAARARHHAMNSSRVAPSRRAVATVLERNCVISSAGSPSSAASAPPPLPPSEPVAQGSAAASAPRAHPPASAAAAAGHAASSGPGSAAPPGLPAPQLPSGCPSRDPSRRSARLSSP